MDMGLHLWPSEAVILRHALMSYRNRIAERWREDGPPPMSDGWEMVAADKLIERLDITSELLLTDDRRRAFAPSEDALTTADAVNARLGGKS